jgi:hypothetical protein
MTSEFPREPRSNAFAPLADVSTDVVQSVLDALLYEHIIAFAKTLPADIPTSRIFVEQRSLPVARVILGNRMPDLADTFVTDVTPPRAPLSDLSTDDVDAAWNQLVQGLADSTPPDSAPDVTDTDFDPPGSGLSARLVRSAQTPGPRDFSLPDPDELLEAEDGFTPPEPPPLPRPSHPADKWGWGATIGGPILLIGSTMAGLPTWIGGVGVAAFIAGFVTLVARMRNERESGDDGAVV